MSKIVLIGAGSSNFGIGTGGDVILSDVFQDSELALMDISEKNLERTYNVLTKAKDKYGKKTKITKTTDILEALKGADYVVISIEVGERFTLWEQDWKIPSLMGSTQVYGENGGPGGLFHALRITPPILKICEQIMELAPDAHVFNYSNPMTRITTTVLRKFPKLKFVGLCHEINFVEQNLPKILKRDAKEIDFIAAGLNHFSFLLEVKDRATGKDLYPEVRANLYNFVETTDIGYKEEVLKDAEVTEFIPWEERHLFKKVFDVYGYMPITSDSHIGEYISWATEYTDHAGIESFYSKYKKGCLTGTSLSTVGEEPTGEHIVDLMMAIETGVEIADSAVNVMNTGLITNLPDYIAVEVPAIVGKDGVKGVSIGEMPKTLASLMNMQAGVYDLTAEAILNESRELALKALLVEPTITSYHAAEKILDTMLQVQKDYLSYLK